MGLIDIIKLKTTVLTSDVSKSQQHQEKKSLGMMRIEPGAAG